MFSWRKQSAEVEVGKLYRRDRDIGPGVSETAQVVSVWDDEVGIPHVRFYRRQGSANSGHTEVDDRTLSLSAFVQLYPQRAAL